jgi:hypothetical protein
MERLEISTTGKGSGAFTFQSHASTAFKKKRDGGLRRPWFSRRGVLERGAHPSAFGSHPPLLQISLRILAGRRRARLLAGQTFRTLALADAGGRFGAARGGFGIHAIIGIDALAPARLTDVRPASLA